LNRLKQLTREKIKERLKNLDKTEKKLLDKRIFEKLINLNEYKQANDIFTYVSFDKEVDTIEIIKYSLKKGKKVYVPKVVKETKRLEVYQIDSINELKKGTYGIPEPIDGKKITKNRFDILLIPGIGFDKLYHRLGRGEGYFDRFLATVEGFKIGLCFSIQIEEKLPTTKNDIKMDMVITDSEILS